MLNQSAIYHVRPQTNNPWNHDISNGSRPEKVGFEISEFATKLLSLGVRQVVICQLFSRFRLRSTSKLDVKTYNKNASIANTYLYHICQVEDNISFWQHDGFRNAETPNMDYYCDDLVHLSNS
ncbi:unnamed protein product [Owenia fusiformis]|uniref:Uncharacterized protein n=1 Tax=Owenia fusiformis TaxID=6347 RepID=A0A8S4PFJ3_OWEFU|nr:unnamed protein product [Owenia fusiformis]